jgi:hypothetical protein
MSISQPRGAVVRRGVTERFAPEKLAGSLIGEMAGDKRYRPVGALSPLGWLTKPTRGRLALWPTLALLWFLFLPQYVTMARHPADFSVPGAVLWSAVLAWLLSRVWIARRRKAGASGMESARLLGTSCRAQLAPASPSEWRTAGPGSRS